MKYVKIVSLSALCTQIVIAAPATAPWMPYTSAHSSTQQAEPLYYNQPHIPLAPAGVISTPPTTPITQISSQNLIKILPTPIAPTNTTPQMSLVKKNPTTQLAHTNKIATTAALISVLKKRHLKGALDAETFQAIMANPILIHARTSATARSKQLARPKSTPQQSLHNKRA